MTTAMPHLDLLTRIEPVGTARQPMYDRNRFEERSMLTTPISLTRGWSTVARKVASWLLDPPSVDDEDLIAPTRLAIESAEIMFSFAEESNWALPSRVVPDGDGGIVLERHEGDVFWSVAIDDGGEVEIMLLDRGKVVGRKSIIIDK